MNHKNSRYFHVITSIMKSYYHNTWLIAFKHFLILTGLILCNLQAQLIILYVLYLYAFSMAQCSRALLHARNDFNFRAALRQVNVRKLSFATSLRHRVFLPFYVELSLLDDKINVHDILSV